MPTGKPSVIAIVAFVAVVQAQAPVARIDAKPAAISPGASTVLNWVTSGASAAFISQLGSVPASGQRVVILDETATYTLVAEGSGGVSISRVTITVTGGRGNVEFPDAGDYQHRFSYRASSPSFPALLDRVHDVLQNQLHYSVRESQEPESAFVFQTTHLIRPDLVPPGNEQIAERRVSFRLTVNRRAPPPAPFPYAIETLIQYRRRLERQQWRNETDALMHETEARRLADLIAQRSQ